MLHRYFGIIATAAIALVVGGATAALSADMPAKAPLRAYAPAAAGGLYLCVETGAAVAKTNVSGNGGIFATSLVRGDLTAAGGTIGGCVGGWYGNDAFRWGWRVSGDYENITTGAVVAAGSNVPVDVASRWSAMQTFRVGGSDPLALIQQAVSNLGVQGFTFPTFTPPVLSGNVNLSAAPKTFIGVGLREAGVKGNFGNVGGATVNFAPVIEVGAFWQTLNASGLPTGGSIEASVFTAWPGKGVEANNVFGTAGGPLLTAAANQGQVYGVRTAWNFAVPGR